MNRLILLGNGFDLAHGMKTSYKDFMLSYLKDSFLAMLENGHHEDAFIQIIHNQNGLKKMFENSDILNCNFNHFSQLIEDNDTLFTDLYNQKFPSQILKYEIKPKNEFISILIKTCSEYNWVDIENEYYKLLCQYSSDNEHDKIKELNKIFEEFQNLLVSYLRKIEEDFIQNESEKFLKSYLIDQLVRPISLPNKQKKLIDDSNPNLIPKNILVLNFNYTSTINEYLNELEKKVNNINCINIHGAIDDSDNPIIFGYGDEEESNFELLERYDECLKFVKTYRYLRTHNYTDFLDFVNSDKFDVIVLGHSCGLSDKTLLSEVFNNDNCYKIKLISHHNKPHEAVKIENTDYITKVYQIGRVFKYKALMRKKLIPFSASDLVNVRKRKI